MKMTSVSKRRNEVDPLEGGNSGGGLFDFAYPIQPKSKIVVGTSGKGNIGKTSTLISLATELSFQKNSRGELNKVAYIDLDFGHSGIKAIIKDLNDHPYGMFEFVKSIDTNRELYLKDCLFPLPVVDKADPQKKGVVYVLPQFGNFSGGKLHKKAMKNFYIMPMNSRSRNPREAKLGLAKEKFREQFIKILDDMFDIVIFDTTGELNSQNVKLMRLHASIKNLVFVNAHSMASIDDSLDYFNEVWTPASDYQPPQIMLLLNDDFRSFSEDHVLHNADYAGELIDRYPGLDPAVVKSKMLTGYFEKDERIEKHEIQQATPWILEKWADKVRAPIQALADFVQTGTYSIPPKKRRGFFS
jgi:cellulose biosynthesis protein BcsQ